MTIPFHIADSARLRYRLMNDNDAPLLFELDQDPEVMRYLNDGRPSTWQEIEELFLPRIRAFTLPAAGLGLWEVRDKATEEYLGWILARHYRFDEAACEPDNIELGWRLKRHCWGKGLASEGARAVMTALQASPDVRVFSAIADHDNLASIGVMKKLGMVFVDDRTHRTPHGDIPVAYYEMPSPV